MKRRPPRSTQSRSSAASDVYKRQLPYYKLGSCLIIEEGLLHCQPLANDEQLFFTLLPFPPSLGGGYACLLYTSDAADDLLCVDLGGRRII